MCEPKKLQLQSLSSTSLLGGIEEINRVWDGTKDPFVCPLNIERLSHRLGIDLSSVEPLSGVIRVLKQCLKKISLNRDSRSVELDLIVEHIAFELSRVQSVASESVVGSVVHKPDSNPLIHGLGKVCVNCEVSGAVKYCLQCCDWLCYDCFLHVHGHGSRRFHESIDLVSCGSEGCSRCALLTCPRSNRSFCAECYSCAYLPGIPLSERTFPVRIDYEESWRRFNEREKLLPDPATDAGNDWYPFCDRFGVVYFYNFKSRESLRRSPISMFDDEDPVADERSDVSARVSRTQSRKFTSPFN
jgi:hypothetical protein